MTCAVKMVIFESIGLLKSSILGDSEIQILMKIRGDDIPKSHSSSEMGIATSRMDMNRNGTVGHMT